mmetsp:Transcript_67149/g.205623  ORF Transcript_67149/g.205623 Transcript_67149/m.205623 type:complete len:205 (+) Transcript_67149:360-974(+)
MNNLSWSTPKVPSSCFSYKISCNIVSISLARFRLAAPMPMVSWAMSSLPVSGSMAAWYVAALSSRVASSTSACDTSSRSSIFAKDSEMRISDSRIRGVAVIASREVPWLRKSKYAFLSAALASLDISGKTHRRAKDTYLRKSSGSTAGSVRFRTPLTEYMETKCVASRVSISRSRLSSMSQMKSNRDMRFFGKWMFSTTESFGS